MPVEPTFNLKRAGDADKVFVVRTLNALIEQEGNFLEQYAVVLDALDDADLKREVAGFRGDHEQRMTELVDAVTELGGVPFEPAGPTPAFELEARMMRKAADAEETLAYMEVGERQAVWLYDAARAAPGLPPDVNAVLERGLQTEQRHHAWAVARVGSETRIRS